MFCVLVWFLSACVCMSGFGNSLLFWIDAKDITQLLLFNWYVPPLALRRTGNSFESHTNIIKHDRLWGGWRYRQLNSKRTLLWDILVTESNPTYVLLHLTAYGLAVGQVVWHRTFQYVIKGLHTLSQTWTHRDKPLPIHLQILMPWIGIKCFLFSQAVTEVQTCLHRCHWHSPHSWCRWMTAWRRTSSPGGSQLAPGAPLNPPWLQT